MLQPETLAFLRDLADHNNREWFQNNRPRYEKARKDFESLVAGVLSAMAPVMDMGNTQVKDCIFRINRDIRFSKDKSPYKKYLSAGLGPGGRNSGRIDFYLHIQPGGESFLGGGMWETRPELLAKYRQEVDYNAAELKAIIEDPVFRRFYPEVWGEVMKTAPKGYPKDHPEIGLLRRKQLFFMHKFPDRELHSPGLVDKIIEGVVLLKPFCDLLNYIFFDEATEEDLSL